MRIGRLFQIVYILLNCPDITASKLALKLEVSVRTIYRDLDELSAAGIPLYTSRGKGGGIKLMEGYKFDKALLSDTDKNLLALGLDSLRVADKPCINSRFQKLQNLIGGKEGGFIEIIHSRWRGKEDDEKFQSIFYAVIKHHPITFDYINADNQKSSRLVYPLKLVFKGFNWYLSAYCTGRDGYRIFKINRMNKVVASSEVFDPLKYTIPINVYSDMYNEKPEIAIKAAMDDWVLNILADTLSPECIKNSGDKIYTLYMPDDAWLTGCLLSFGSGLKVLEPQFIINRLRMEISKMKQLYN